MIGDQIQLLDAAHVRQVPDGRWVFDAPIDGGRQVTYCDRDEEGQKQAEELREFWVRGFRAALAVPASKPTVRLLTLAELWECRDGALEFTGQYEEAIQRAFMAVNGLAEGSAPGEAS